MTDWLKCNAWTSYSLNDLITTSLDWLPMISWLKCNRVLQITDPDEYVTGLGAIRLYLLIINMAQVNKSLDW